MLKLNKLKSWRIVTTLYTFPLLRNMRGGRVVFQPIQKPNVDEWVTALNAVEASFDLEKSVHESLLSLHKNADEHGDAQLTDFLEGEYLKEQVN